MDRALRGLVADDNELMRAVIKGFVRKFMPTSEVFETQNLSETFTMLITEHFDSLLLDTNVRKKSSNPDTVKGMTPAP